MKIYPRHALRSSRVILESKKEDASAYQLILQEPGMNNEKHFDNHPSFLDLKASNLAQRVRNCNIGRGALLASVHNQLEQRYSQMRLESLTRERKLDNPDMPPSHNTKSRIIWIANSINLLTPLRCSHMRSVGATVIPHLLMGADVHYVLCGLPCGGIGSPEGNASNTFIPRASEMKYILSQNIGRLGGLIDTSSCDINRESDTILERITRVGRLLGALMISGSDVIIHQGCILGTTLPMHLLRTVDCKQFVHMMCIDNDISSLPKSVVPLSPDPQMPEPQEMCTSRRVVYKRPSVNLVAPLSSGPHNEHSDELERIGLWLNKSSPRRILLSCGAHLQNRIDMDWLVSVREFAQRTRSHILMMGVTANKNNICKVLGRPQHNALNESFHICGWIQDPTHVFKLLSRMNAEPAYIFPGSSGGGHDQICAAWHGIPIYMYGVKDSACSLPPYVFFDSPEQVFHQIEAHWTSHKSREDFINKTRTALRNSFLYNFEYSLALYRSDPKFAST